MGTQQSGRLVGGGNFAGAIHPVVSKISDSRFLAVLVQIIFVFALKVFPSGFPIRQVVISGTATNAQSSIAADFDHDGDVDLASAMQGTKQIVWYSNNAAGVFSVGSIVAQNIAGLFQLAAGDLDGDGDQDIVRISTNDHSVVWHANDGRGGFDGGILVYSNQDANSALAVMDLEPDGDLDIMAAKSNLVVLINDGSSTPLFVLVTNLPGFRDIRNLCVKDLNHDGRDDLVAAEYLGDSLFWLANNGMGAFSSPVYIATNVIGPEQAIAGDIDNDGDMDLALTSSGDDLIRWFENSNGLGAFADGIVLLTSDVANVSIALADIDADGDNDLLTANQQVYYLENDGHHPPGFTSDYFFPAGVLIRSLLVADIDLDGDTDLFVTSRGNRTISWLRNVSIHATAVFVQQAIVSEMEHGAQDAMDVDIDGDGDSDLLGLSRSDGLVWWYENVNKGTNWLVHTINTNSLMAERVDAADIDRDGDLDVVASSWFDDKIVWFQNSGNGSSNWMERIVGTGLVDVVSVDVADLNGDGSVDILSGQAGPNPIVWHNNALSNGTLWQYHAVTGSLASADEVRAVDLDRDGHIDVLQIDRQSDSIVWLSNLSGNGANWSSRVVTSSGGGISSGLCLDLDRDGDWDVVTSNTNQNRVVWYKNMDGKGGAWLSGVISSGLGFPQSVQAADIDRDGDMDVVSASAAGNSFIWHVSRSLAGTSWIDRAVSGPLTGATDCAIVDINSDGNLDVVGIAASNGIRSFASAVGQFALQTTDMVPPIAASGGTVPVFRIEFSHLGRTGDDRAELAKLELRFGDSLENPLTTLETSNLINKIMLSLDNGNGVFQPGIDTQVYSTTSFSLSNGFQSFYLPTNLASLSVAANTNKIYFLTMGLTPEAFSQNPNEFWLEHVTEFSSTARHISNSILLRMQFTSNVTSRTVQALEGASLRMTKSGPQMATAGISVITWAVTASNAGPGRATNVIVVDRIPAQTTPAGVVTVLVSHLDAGMATSLLFYRTLSPEALGVITNVAFISSLTPDPQVNDNTATSLTLVATEADLALSKVGQQIVTSGISHMTWTVSISNAGPSVARNIVMTENIPFGVEIPAIPLNGGTCNVEIVRRSTAIAYDASIADNFGRSVAISGSNLLVGASGDDVTFGNAGSAHILVWGETNWIHQAKLLAPDPLGLNEFGKAVAIDGNTALVGCPGDDHAGGDAGSAYVFVLSGTNWALQTKLTYAYAQGGDHAGASVALSGDTAVVGVPDRYVNGGEARVYVRTGTNWNLQANLGGDQSPQSIRFGTSVAIFGDTIVVGAPYETHIVSGDGAAYIFVRQGTNWSRQTKFYAGFKGDFGRSVDLFEDTALIAAPNEIGGNDFEAGIAYFYSRSGTNWSYLDSVDSDDTGDSNHFGTAVSLSGDLALIGEPFRDGPPIDSGAAHLFRRIGNDWTRVQRITAGIPGTNDQLGSSVALAGYHAIVGAYVDDSPLVDAGSVLACSLLSRCYIQQLAAGTSVEMNVISAIGEEFIGVLSNQAITSSTTWETGSNNNAAVTVTWVYRDDSDVDGDMMPDGWEIRYFDHLTNSGGDDDMDWDMMSTLAEYISDTDPSNNNSVFEIEDAIHESVWSFNFESSTSRLYSLEYNDGIPSNTWLGLNGQTNAIGTGSTMSLMDSNEISATRTYRLKVKLP